jgi:hypothetical protein
MLRLADGSSRYGVGRHADILEASLQAVLSSANRLDVPAGAALPGDLTVSTPR